MITTVIPLYQELNGSKKDGVWCDSCVRIMRRDWRRLNNISRANNDRSLMYSVQELTEVKNSFDDEDFKKSVKFYPLPILEPIVNSIVEDITQKPPKAELKALDPTAVTDKKNDLELLKNRSILENDRTELQSRVGLPDYKLGYDNFNGNVEEFDKLGFDSEDPEDVTFYENNIQKLNAEIAGQSVINTIFKNSRFDKELMRRLVKDVVATKTICEQKYVDKITGEIKDRYIDPQTARGIFGVTNDGTDDVCRGWEDGVTVMQWLQMVGNEFVFERDWRFLLWGINYCNIQKFTGFIRNGVPFDCCSNVGWMTDMGLNDVAEPNLIDWSMAYTYKIYIGYIEWRSPEATTTFLKNDKTGFLQEIPYGLILKKKQVKEGYETESRYQIPWYSCYYIATTSVSQWVWGFGKVFLSSTYGANDEYCNGTLHYYQEEGLSAVEISKPYLQIANFTFYRMLWVIYKAKPDPDEFVFDELIQLAGTVQRQFPQGGTNTTQTPGLTNILQNIIKEQRAKHVRIRTYPRIDGRPVQQIHPIEQKGRGGLDPIAVSMQAVCQWAENMIMQKIGINPMRLGQDPPSRESTKSEENTLRYSMSTTGYIYRMIQYLKEKSAVCSLNYAQDIIKFKSSLPAKWLKNIIGDESFKDLAILDKFAAHRCGLFIDDYNTEVSKEEVKQAATIALTNDQITWDQWFFISQTDDVKKASKLLGRYKEKAEKQAQEFELQKLQMADQNQEKVHQRKMQEINLEGEWRFKTEQERTRSFISAAQIEANNKINIKEIQQGYDVSKQEQKNQGAIKLETEKKNLEAQQPLAT